MRSLPKSSPRTRNSSLRKASVSEVSSCLPSASCSLFDSIESSFDASLGLSASGVPVSSVSFERWLSGERQALSRQGVPEVVEEAGEGFGIEWRGRRLCEVCLMGIGASIHSRWRFSGSLRTIWKGEEQLLRGWATCMCYLTGCWSFILPSRQSSVTDSRLSYCGQRKPIFSTLVLDLSCFVHAWKTWAGGKAYAIWTLRIRGWDWRGKKPND